MALLKSTKATKKYGISLETVNKVLKSAEIPSIRVGSGKNRTDLFDGAAFEKALTEWIIANPKKPKTQEQLKKLNNNLKKARKAAAKKRKEEAAAKEASVEELSVEELHEQVLALGRAAAEDPKPASPKTRARRGAR